MSRQHSPTPSQTLPSTARVASLRSQHSRTSTPTRPNAQKTTTPSPRPSHSSNSTPLKKHPSYTESALEITSSPPLTSFLNDRHSASSAQEEAYLRASFRQRVLRLIICALTLITALAALGVEGHILQSYNETRLGRDWQLPLWPINIDVRPTLGVLIPAAIIAAFNLVYILLALIPSPHSRTSLLTKSSLLLTTLSLITALFALAFPLTLTHTTDPSLASPRDTIHSFTCRYYRNAVSFNRDSAELGIPIFQELKWPTGFKGICVQTEVGVGLMGAVLGLCAVGVAVGVWGWIAERGIERGRRERWEGKWSGVAIEEKA